MHRDLKLGLALAVLLIGSTTAFFFRNDADPNAGLPQLRNASELDQAVAQRDAAPYLGAPEPAPLPAADAIAASPWAKPAFLGGSAAIVRNVSVTPDPIQRVIEADIEPTAGTVGEIAAAKPVTPQFDADGAAIHIVQSGDTLSGLSMRYLGSIARFDEIYELNRDQLKGPHDLKIGMTLRIPSSQAATAPVNEASPFVNVGLTETDEPVEDEALPSDATPAVEQEAIPAELTETAAAVEKPAASKLFTPAKRTPFVPSRYRAPMATK